MVIIGSMALSGQERREQIQRILEQSKVPVAGTDLAKQLDVSRQVVVQDIALIRAEMNIRSRRDVRNYMEGITSGKSTNLMKLTSNYHYHKIVAEDEHTLDLIQQELQKKGFLAQLQEYEPVDFAVGK